MIVEQIRQQARGILGSDDRAWMRKHILRLYLSFPVNQRDDMAAALTPELRTALAARLTKLCPDKVRPGQQLEMFASTANQYRGGL